MTLYSADATQGLLEAFATARNAMARVPRLIAAPSVPPYAPFARTTLSIEWTRRPSFCVVPQSGPGKTDGTVVHWVDLYCGPLTFQIRDQHGLKSTLDVLTRAHQTAVAVFLDGTEGRAKIVLVGDAYQLSLVNARGGMFEELCAELPWSQRLTEVWRMEDPEERDASLAIRALRGNRLRTAVKWYRDKGRLHSGDPIAMAADAFDAYLTDSAAGKDALLVCDTWEIADAINLRLHHKLAKVGPSLTVTRDQAVGVGDIIMNRRNDATVTVYPHNEHLGDKTDQVRNGNRWRVATIDLDTNRIAAERLSDGARAVFDGDYLKQHVTLGYATTVHSAQGVTADSCYAVLGEGSSRAMAYVAMTRGRHNNEAFLYQRLTDERDHEHSRLTFGQATHAARRSNKYSAAQHFRTILAIDDRPRTVHADAERAESQLLPDVVAEVRTRNRERCRARRVSWRVHLRAAELWSDGHERMASAERASTADLDAGGLAL